MKQKYSKEKSILANATMKKITVIAYHRRNSHTIQQSASSLAIRSIVVVFDQIFALFVFFFRAVFVGSDYVKSLCAA